MNSNRRSPVKPQGPNATPVSTKKPQSPKNQSGRNSVPHTPQNKKPAMNRQHSSQPEFASPVVSSSPPRSNSGRSSKSNTSPKPLSPVSDSVTSSPSRRQAAADRSQGSPSSQIPFASSKYLDTIKEGNLPLPPSWMFTTVAVKRAPIVAAVSAPVVVQVAMREPIMEPQSPTTMRMVQAALRNGFDGGVHTDPFKALISVCAS